MCLAIPMQVVELDGLKARCQAKGIEREVSLFMLRDEVVEVGDFVSVQLGYAVQKVSERDAFLSWQLFDQILAETDGGC